MNESATTAALLKPVYGSAEPDEQLWKAAFTRHNKAVRDAIPADQLLIMDVGKGHGYKELCAFLGRAGGVCQRTKPVGFLQSAFSH